jgi:hypothetical protein
MVLGDHIAMVDDESEETELRKQVAEVLDAHIAYRKGEASNIHTGSCNENDAPAVRPCRARPHKGEHQ